MTELQSLGDSGLPHIPDNLTIAQFMLDYQHEIRPTRGNVSCLIDDQSGDLITLATLKERTEYLANGLCMEYEIGDNDIVMLISPNHIDYPIAMWAIHRLGGVVTFSNPQFKPNEIAYQLTTAKVTFIVVHSLVLGIALSAARLVEFPLDRIILLDQSSASNTSSMINSVPELICVGRQKTRRTFYERPLDQGEGKTKIALLCWSSGTTGNPKAVAIPHRALIANIIQMAAHNQVDRSCGHRDNRSYRPGDVALGVLPFYHVAGLVLGLHLVLFSAMTLVVVPKYDFMDMLNTISRHKVSHLILVPPQAVMFSKHPAVLQHDYSKIRYVMIGAAPVSREVQERLCEIFPSAQIGQAYGLTEMTTTLAMVSAAQKQGPLGSGGRLLPGIQAQVIKSDGSLARFGERGELVVKGPGKALGYFGNLQATNEAFVDGWVRTGDDVILTADREIFVFDRIKEIIKVKGFQVAPAELEGCLLSHPDVADACVVGIADDYSGELPVAYVVLTAEAAQSLCRNAVLADYFSESISKYVEDRKASYKHLTGGIRFIDSIPRNGSGKALRRLLRNDSKQTSSGCRGRVKL